MNAATTTEYLFSAPGSAPGQINIGAGDLPVAGYYGVDSHGYTGVDLVCRVPPLPWPDTSVQEIFTGHFLEHLEPWQVLPFLAECHRVLIPGGSLTVVVPDADKGRLMLESRVCAPTQYALIVQGAKYDDMPHYTLWNPARVQAALAQAGLDLDLSYTWREDSRVYDRETPWQCGARGVKR